MHAAVGEDGVLTPETVSNPTRNSPFSLHASLWLSPVPNAQLHESPLAQPRVQACISCPPIAWQALRLSVLCIERARGRFNESVGKDSKRYLCIPCSHILSTPLPKGVHVSTLTCAPACCKSKSMPARSRAPLADPLFPAGLQTHWERTTTFAFSFVL